MTPDQIDAVNGRLAEAYRLAGPAVSPSMLPINADDYNVLGTESGAVRSLGPGSLYLVHKSVELPQRAIGTDTGKRNLVVVGPNVRLGGAILQCQGQRGVTVIGARASFAKGCLLQTSSRDNWIVFGTGSSWQGGEMIVSENDQGVVVGDDCLFSSDISIRTTDGHPIYDMDTGERINPPGPIRVGRHCWIGRGARISKDVTLAEGTVIGQAAVVTKDTMPNSVYAGCPAKLIRSNVRWERSMATPPPRPKERDEAILAVAKPS